MKYFIIIDIFFYISELNIFSEFQTISKNPKLPNVQVKIDQ